MANKPIGTLGAVDTLTIAGRVFTDLTNLIELFGTTTASKYSGLSKTGSQTASAYQITTGKTYKCGAILGECSSTNGNILAGQCDNALAYTTATTPVNPIYFLTEDTGSAGVVFSAVSSLSGNSDLLIQKALNFGKIASQKFGVIAADATVATWRASLFGYES